MKAAAPGARQPRVKRWMLWTLLPLSKALYWYSDYVWGKCGHDCGIFGDGGGWGPAAMPTLYISLVVFMVSAIALIVSHVREWRQRKSGV